MAAIELDGVTKRFGDVTAVQDLSLSVPEGTIFGFLGPNGAGKSTTIDMLLDFVRPTEGQVSVLGLDAQDESLTVRAHTGVLPEGFSVYDRLTGRQHVEFAVESKNARDDPIALLERVGIADAADRKAGGYSKGMKQRLALAIALAGEPDLLVLDEPTSGLDPGGAKELRDIIRAEAERGATVFFSSHVLGQVEAVCDEVGILRNGELVAVGTIDELRDRTAGEAQLHVSCPELPDAALAAARDLPGVGAITVDNGDLVVTCDHDVKVDVLVVLEDHGATVRDFRTEEASLEELFLTLTADDDQPAAESPEAATDGSGAGTGAGVSGSAGSDEEVSDA